MGHHIPQITTNRFYKPQMGEINSCFTHIIIDISGIHPEESESSTHPQLKRFNEGLQMSGAFSS